MSQHDELIERLNQAIRLHENDPFSGEKFIRKVMMDAIAALSAPSVAPQKDAGDAPLKWHNALAEAYGYTTPSPSLAAHAKGEDGR